MIFQLELDSANKLLQYMFHDSTCSRKKNKNVAMGIKDF